MEFDAGLYNPVEMLVKRDPETGFLKRTPLGEKRFQAMKARMLELEYMLEDMSSEEKEAQRRSFAYGNTKMKNDDITRKMIDELAEEIEAEKSKVEGE